MFVYIFCEGAKFEGALRSMNSTQSIVDQIQCRQSLSPSDIDEENVAYKEKFLSALPRSSSGQSFGRLMYNSPDEFSSEDEEFSELPPPKATVTRGLSSTMLNIGTLSRARSSSPRKVEASSQPQERRGMTRVRSMPCLQFDRSAYNRSVGQAVLASVSEHDGSKGRGEAKKRVEEFDQLLQEFE